MSAIYGKVFLLGDKTLGRECTNKQEGQRMLCLLAIKRKSIRNVILAAGVTSKEGKPRGSCGNVSYAGKAQWAGLEKSLKIDRISLVLYGWVCRLFPHPARTSAAFVKSALFTPSA